MESIRSARREARIVAAPADDPPCGLTDHLAVLVQQKDDGACRLDLLTEVVLEGEGHDCLLADHLWLIDGDDKLCTVPMPAGDKAAARLIISYTLTLRWTCAVVARHHSVDDRFNLIKVYFAANGC